MPFGGERASQGLEGACRQPGGHALHIPIGEKRPHFFWRSVEGVLAQSLCARPYASRTAWPSSQRRAPFRARDTISASPHFPNTYKPVSYTHLTLPTILRV